MISDAIGGSAKVSGSSIAMVASRPDARQHADQRAEQRADEADRAGSRATARCRSRGPGCRGGPCSARSFDASGAEQLERKAEAVAEDRDAQQRQPDDQHGCGACLHHPAGASGQQHGRGNRRDHAERLDDQREGDRRGGDQREPAPGNCAAVPAGAADEATNGDRAAEQEQESCERDREIARPHPERGADLEIEPRTRQEEGADGDEDRTGREILAHAAAVRRWRDRAVSLGLLRLRDPVAPDLGLAHRPRPGFLPGRD